MRPFQEFTFWTRQASAWERVSAGLGLVVVMALLSWLLVPDRNDSSVEEVAANGGRAAADPAPGSSSTEPGTSDVAAERAQGDDPAPLDAQRSASRGGSTSTGASLSPGGAERECVAPPGSTKGITASEVRIAVALTEIVGPAANAVFNLPPPAVQQANFEAVIAGINKEGGVACRKLVARYVIANPANESQMMGLCRDVADSDAFGIADTGSLASRPAVLACFGQNKVPFFSAYFVTEAARTRFYPYIYSIYTREHIYKSTAFALRDLGFFDPAKGFRKLGFIYKDCEREAITAFRGWIRGAGVPDGRIVSYSVGCPAAFANPADLAQAVLTFQREGVTHVTVGNFQGDLPRFTDVAERQGFRPKYGFPDEAIISLSAGTLAPNPDNIADAIAITLGRDAENRTPGMKPTAGTLRCDAYYRAAGRRTTYEQDEIAGNACNQLWMLQGALGRAPELGALALPAGLQQTKSIDFSFPQGPTDFSGNRVTTGGQFWRVAQFMRTCDCWHVVQRDFRRGYS